MSKNLPAKGEFLVYQTDDGQVKLDVRLEKETIWLTQAQMCELFGRDQSVISRHVRNVLKEGELPEKSNMQKMHIAGSDKPVTLYSLDMIISVGYRVKSLIATRFRIWATARLKEYIVKGFVLDDERLKNPPVAGSGVPDYFDEMLARIRDIRSSERRMYLRVREIFAMAADYDLSRDETTKFFSIIQNKLHFAATGMTAAELIQSRADAQLPNMGLTSWQKSEVRKTDITIAKNYLKEDEIDGLNRIVTMWLDYAEDKALRRKQVFMKDWETKLDEFLVFNERQVLDHAGTVSKNEAETHAQQEYHQFAERRREHKEQIGEADSIKMLEDAAKQLPEHKE